MPVFHYRGPPAWLVRLRRSVVAMLLCCTVAVALETESNPFAAHQLAVPVSAMQWTSCPGTLPAGCEMAVLEGNPRESGLFTVRFRVAAGFTVPLHTHPQDERVTVFSGRVATGFGRAAIESNARVFGPGDYYVNAREAEHKVWVQEASEIQVTGFGPWVVNLIETDDQ